MNKKNYYSILGIDSRTGDEDLKKAYRKLAFLYHPDRNNGNKEAEERFKEISEAYAVLSDKGKRSYYDRYGHTKFKQRYEHDDFFREANFADFAQDLFHFKDSRYRGFGCRGRGRGKGCGMGKFARGFYSDFGRERFSGSNECLYDLPLTDSEAFLGTKKEISLHAGWQTQRVLLSIPPKVKDGAVIRLTIENQPGMKEEVFLRVKIV